MQYSENYYGTLPRLDESKAYDVNIRNTPAKLGGVNYTTDESLWNYYPLLAEWDGRILEASTGDYTVKTGLVSKMVESFKAGEQSGAPGDPIGVDCEHRIYSENGGKLIGYVVDVREYAGEIITYTASDVRVVKENPENTLYLMAKMAWLTDGYELVKSGALPFPSVVFTESENGSITMGIPTITGNPADKAVPAIVACTAKTIESEDNMNRDQLITGLMEYINTLDDVGLQALYDQLVNAAPTEEATPEPTAEASGTDEIKGMLQNILDRLNAPVAATEKPDEGVVTAKAELIKSGVLPSVASDLANNFAGIPAKESVICAKAYIDNNPIKLGSQVAGVIPVDTYETLMKKFQKEGHNTLEASKLAREALKGDN